VPDIQTQECQPTVEPYLQQLEAYRLVNQPQHFQTDDFALHSTYDDIDMTVNFCHYKDETASATGSPNGAMEVHELDCEQTSPYITLVEG
jgi:hypothetical protein